MSFIKSQIEMLKDAIDNGIVTKDSPLILEQKERIIDMLFDMYSATGVELSKSQIGASVDKIFADILGIK